MPSKSGFEGIYRSAESPKRRAEVRERLRSGFEVKRIARDLGLDPAIVEQIVEQIRAEDAGQPPVTPG